MKELEKIFNDIAGYLISIKRDTLKGYYILEVGIPANWTFKSNNLIKCELLTELEDGKIINIIPNDDSDCVIDDQFQHLYKIIDSNNKIAELEKEMLDTVNKRKKELEEELEKSFKGIEDFKDKAFNDVINTDISVNNNDK
jgi:hypothetical protein